MPFCLCIFDAYQCLTTDPFYQHWCFRHNFRSAWRVFDWMEWIVIFFSVTFEKFLSIFSLSFSARNTAAAANSFQHSFPELYVSSNAKTDGCHSFVADVQCKNEPFSAISGRPKVVNFNPPISPPTQMCKCCVFWI